MNAPERRITRLTHLSDQERVERALRAAFVAEFPGACGIGAPALTAIYALSVCAEGVLPDLNLSRWAHILTDAADKLRNGHV